MRFKRWLAAAFILFLGMMSYVWATSASTASAECSGMTSTVVDDHNNAITSATTSFTTCTGTNKRIVYRDDDGDTYTTTPQCCLTASTNRNIPIDSSTEGMKKRNYGQGPIVLCPVENGTKQIRLCGKVIIS